MEDSHGNNQISFGPKSSKRAVGAFSDPIGSAAGALESLECVECRAQHQEGHQTLCQPSPTSRPGGHAENLSTETRSLVRGIHSLSSSSVGIGEATQRFRSDAFTLIRARTHSCISGFDLSVQRDNQETATEDPSASEGLPDSMVYDKASIMDFMTATKPKKKNNKGKRKKKGGDAASDNKASSEELKLHYGGPSKTGNESVSLPFRSKHDSAAKPEAAKQAGFEEPQQSASEMSSGATDVKGKGKGKQRVSGPDAVLEGEISNKDVAQPTAQASSVKKKPDICQAAIETAKSPELGAMKDPKSSTSSLSRQTSLRRTVSMKEKLPFVKEGKIQQGSIFGESPFRRASTPKSTGTTSSSSSIGWTTNTGIQLTPQTTAASESSSSNRNKQGTPVTSRPPAPASSQVMSTHAHPSPSSSRTIEGQPTTPGGRAITTQNPEGFFWQLDSHGFPCTKADCDKRCNLWDGATVICPRCGPYSTTRYCSSDHLFEDIKMHWISCGSMVFQHPCRESSIPRQVRLGPPLVPCIHPYDTPERHRQAVYFNANSRRGDYFIFSDWIDIEEAGFPDDCLALRCSSRLVHVVEFRDAEEKDRFRRVLAACLFLTLEAHELVDYLFRLIRDNFRTSQSQTTFSSLEETLKYQIHQEFAVTIQPAITGERHACPTDWDGRNRRNCQDPICRSEFRRLLGALGGRGHEKLIEHLEGSYWILRAVRTTHPDVADAGARMRGVGYEDLVAEEDKRVFYRGDGWDGAGNGEMEVEGTNA